MSDIKPYTEFKLPASVVSRTDVSRLLTDLERVDNELTAADVKAKAGAPAPATPVMSEQLTTFLQENDLHLENTNDRSEIVTQLRLLKDNVSVVHMTFAVAADQESLSTLVAWLRESVHPQAVIAVGLQPSLIAGVYLRTVNQVKDLSLRARLQGSHDVLVKELEQLRHHG